jgi:hypothetical protein
MEREEVGAFARGVLCREGRQEMDWFVSIVCCISAVAWLGVDYKGGSKQEGCRIPAVSGRAWYLAAKAQFLHTHIHTHTHHPRKCVAWSRCWGLTTYADKRENLAISNSSPVSVSWAGLYLVYLLYNVLTFLCTLLVLRLYQFLNATVS